MKRIILIAVTAVTMSAGGFAVAAVAAPPENGPPGQGECAHGNSGKPCKPDPQPEHGKDCEEHGPKEGGVNEDHCAGTTDPDPTTPDPTTPDPTTPDPTTPDPTIPEETTTSDTTTTSTETMPEPGVPVVPPVTPPADGNTPNVDVTELEEELEKQAKANGADNAPTATARPANELPYTGLPLLAVVALGAGLVASGLGLRRMG